MSGKRPLLVAGNWKMTHDRMTARNFVQALVPHWKDGLSAIPTHANVRAEIYAPLLSMEALKNTLAEEHLPIQVGAQNVHWEEKGAFTGEISVSMLLEAGIERVLVGHSERRQHFGETDVTVKKRTERALGAGMEVILCLGETREDREGGRTEAVLEKQLMQGLPSEWNSKLVLAYEPVWAIGTGLTASPEQAEAAHAFIRAYLSNHYGDEPSSKTLILYGGSVTPANAVGIFKQPNVDGGLVGGASLNPESYAALLAAAIEVARG